MLQTILMELGFFFMEQDEIRMKQMQQRDLIK